MAGLAFYYGFQKQSPPPVALDAPVALDQPAPARPAGEAMRDRMEAFIKGKQQEIVAAIAAVDGTDFRVDEWQRPGGGGGISCVLQDGNVFEKAGVNISVVYGKLPPQAVTRMRADHKSLKVPESGFLPFYACGLSLVIHPKNPNAPTVHLNYRYFETENEDGTPQSWWFGGGSDLTPSYLFEDDARFFHSQLKAACDKHDASYYPRFKEWCDKYFYIKHRNESRGIGGIFFDDLDDKDPELIFAFVRECLSSFLPTYVPIIERRKDLPFSEKQKEWQQVRRGRYVEFNLVYDRGTSFGLQTPGSRVESILMSLPLTAAWMYQYEPEPETDEAAVVAVLKEPKEWA
ncbi:coproporphyrinogen III oxidase [Dipodascopsis tothii]|uniref:coproporphyrinogen III oxidase n=1 Tax=Dipodascopsis tothii TaxID=44089 RepID=UPI0034CFDF67